MYEKILVPLDGSGLAEAALTHAQRFAHHFESEIVLLRVVTSPYAMVAPDLVLAGSDPHLPQLTRHAERYLEAVAGSLRAQDIAVHTEVCEGPIAEAIVDQAQALNIDMIVMSTRGRGGMSRWVYGSVAERVLQAATCPVLLVRTNAR